MTQIQQFDPLHGDRVVALHVNFDGTRILTASVDHRIKIWSRNTESGGELKLLDVFKAHDGDVKDAKWFHPTTGTHIATCGSDRLLRIFTFDASSAPNSGRTFQPIAQISSKSPVPFVSLDLKTLSNASTYLAAIDRTGQVTIFVPETPDKFNEWRRLAQWSVCPPPGNGEETSFKIRFEPNPTSLAYVVGASDERNTLSLVVTAMDTLKVYHAVLPGPGVSGTAEFIEVASHTPTPGVLLRDVQWAPFNVRGVDLLAAASRNGDICILEMRYSLNPSNSNNNGNGTPNYSTFPRHTHQSSSSSSNSRPPPPQSSLTTAIAGRSNPNPNPALPQPHSSRSTITTSLSHRLPYSTSLTLATRLHQAHDDAWSLAWDSAGQVLMSSGSEGRTCMWRRSILEGEWREFSSVEFEVKEEGGGGGRTGGVVIGNDGRDGANGLIGS